MLILYIFSKNTLIDFSKSESARHEDTIMEGIAGRSLTHKSLIKYSDGPVAQSGSGMHTKSARLLIKEPSDSNPWAQDEEKPRVRGFESRRAQFKLV